MANDRKWHQCPSVAGSSVVRGVLAVLAAALSAGALAAEPAQIPLTSQSAPPLKPSVMLTVDDSFSMRADSMPDGWFDVNGHSVMLSPSSSGASAFPFDATKRHSADKWTSDYYIGVVISDPAERSAFQMQFRSPDVNSIFYNPDVRYRPWMSPDGSGTRLPDVDPTAAPYDAGSRATVIDLTTNRTGLTGVWCTSPGHCTSSTHDFYPGRYYRLKPGADPESVASYTVYDVNGPDHAGPPAAAAVKHPDRTDCAGDACTQAEERQNFANWFAYYRERLDLNKAAISETFVNYRGKMRLGWGSINYSGPDGVVREPIRELDSTQLATLLTGVQAMGNATFTPLRKALISVGDYFRRTDAMDPWRTDIGDASSPRLACRRAVNVLMSDGYYNDAATDFPAVGNVDAADGPVIGSNPDRHVPERYFSGRPYADSYADTLADVAMNYYVGDLSAAADNRVVPREGDIAYWQHLTQFTIGLGVRGTLDASTPAAKAGTLAALADGRLAWPDPSCADCAEAKIDDLWHAAVNTGGDFFSVRNVSELTKAFDAAFGESIVGSSVSAGVATSATTLSAGNVKFVPSFEPAAWTGDLTAWKLDANGKVATPGAPEWTASELMPPWSTRRLFTWSGTAGVPFAWDDLDVAARDLVGSAALVDYVRGDASLEGATYRKRDGRPLGDFVNSPPLLVKDLLLSGYDRMAGYGAFRDAKKARDRGVVFVGANDGMLHGFDSKSGLEVFGYLPRGGLARLSQVASVDYGTATNFHRFFVDGPQIESDVVLGTEWANVVVGAMGAGGKGLFALHVPTTYPAALGAGSVLWDITASDDEDLGYVVADFAVGKVRDGGWKVFVGNGVHSDSGRAALLIIDVATGHIDKVVADDGTGNGLMGVSLIKDISTQEVVGAYAGDLKGRLWRFDFEAGGGAGSWKVGFSGSPLFEATSPAGGLQPITAPPVFVPHERYGRVVLFGTGALYDAEDAGDASTQTYYGVWDTTPLGESSSGLPSPFDGESVDRTALQPQSADLTREAARRGDDTPFFSVTTTPVDWATLKGWYMDLPVSRQRVIYPTTVIADDFVLISTIIPALAAEDCTSSHGVGYNFLLSARDGLQYDTPIFDTNGDGIVDSSDTAASAFKTESDGRDVVMFSAGDDRSGSIISSAINPVAFKVQCVTNCDPRPIADRVWRRLLNPPTP